MVDQFNTQLFHINIIIITELIKFQIVTGRWLVDGNPQVILMDIGSAAWKLDEFKADLWENCNIGIPHLDIETNDAVILGSMVAKFVTEVG